MSDKKEKKKRDSEDKSKVTKEKEEKEEDDGGSYLEAKKYISEIASPLATEKLTKKCFKLVKKSSKIKKTRRGVKEVVKAIRKSEKGICILAGNISPIDVISHIPVLCEENGIPYIYVPAKEDLGASALTKRPTSCVLIPAKVASDDEYNEKATEIIKGIQDLTPST
eukprot:c22070_g1_i1.p1 GENE.c22070_g1_i1~~c22070_g1_i1.p1  ORF type:complete len:178 (+),score=69.16 c22070_g1_i1:35-535(+)